MARKLKRVKTPARVVTLREQMVDLVLDFAGDEIESVQDAIQLAIETEEELLVRLRNLIEYYKYEAER